VRSEVSGGVRCVRSEASARSEVSVRSEEWVSVRSEEWGVRSEEGVV
jgi:hypothetical protein